MPSPPARDDPHGWVGTTIDGRFAVDAVVGEGGFDVVYRGRHLSLDEPVAIECLKIPATLGEEERLDGRSLEDVLADAKAS